GNMNEGPISGSFDATGRIREVSSFPTRRSSDLTSIPVAGLTHWTIALWAKWSDGTNVYEHPIGLGKGHDATFWFSGTILAFKTADGSGNTVIDNGVSSTISTRILYHLAATFDGS